MVISDSHLQAKSSESRVASLLTRHARGATADRTQPQAQAISPDRVARKRRHRRRGRGACNRGGKGGTAKIVLADVRMWTRKRTRRQPSASVTPADRSSSSSPSDASSALVADDHSAADYLKASVLGRPGESTPRQPVTLASSTRAAAAEMAQNRHIISNVAMKIPDGCPTTDSAPSSSHQPPTRQARFPSETAGRSTLQPSSESSPRSDGWDESMPRAYNDQYPHPLTVYASPSVNPASVEASGYAPLLEKLKQADPTALIGTIIAECDRDDLTAPALMLGPDSKEGCGIPEEYWIRLSSWAGVKVPLGAVVPLARSRGAPGPRFLNNVPSGRVTPPLSSSGSTTTFDTLDHIPLTPSSPLFSPELECRQLAARSEADLRQQYLEQSACGHGLLPGLSSAPRRGSLPDLRLGQNRAQPPSQTSQQARLGSMTDEELMKKLLGTAAAMGLSHDVVQQSFRQLGRRLSYDQPSPSNLSPVFESEDDVRLPGVKSDSSHAPIIFPSPSSPRPDPLDEWRLKSHDTHAGTCDPLWSHLQLKSSLRRRSTDSIASRLNWDSSQRAGQGKECRSPFEHNKDTTLAALHPSWKSPASDADPTTHLGGHARRQLGRHEQNEHESTKLLHTEPWHDPSSMSFDFSTGKSIWS